MIETVGRTGSTNADLLARVRDGGAPNDEGVWLRALAQDAGHGRSGRTWHSGSGNLAASTIIRVRADDPPVTSLSLLCGIALYDAIVVCAGISLPGMCLKWPNDVLIDGAKVAGILLEREGDAIVAGFGVNVTARPDLRRSTTSLLLHGLAVDAECLLDRLAEQMAQRLVAWRAQGIEPLLNAWSVRGTPAGTAMTVRRNDGVRVVGTFVGLTQDGALCLHSDEHGDMIIHSGDVWMLGEESDDAAGD